MKSLVKKALVTLFSFVMLTTSLVACSKSGVKNTHYQSANMDAKYQIVCTIFPIYDWVTNIVGDNDNVNVTLLLDQGADLHSFQPTTADIALIANADMFIFVGGESDEWAIDAASNAKNKNQKAINLMEVLKDNVIEEELKEGMQAEESEESEESEEIEYDEHVWLSLNNAIKSVKNITSAICEMDSENSAIYTENSNRYITELTELDSQYKDVVNNATIKTLIFGDRFPFVYMTNDYDLDYFAAFVGCSAETEASFETISFLAEKINSLNAKYVITIENSDKKIANTIINSSNNKDAKVVTLNSMQSVKGSDIAKGTSYMSIMQDNLSILKDVLAN
ncbi:metal ABC transporter substrate-binding protein [Lachnospira multipara]|uniref:metal ABC transporter substrate-binding protein n=1 Tax=Lachnospira multipara TaxID=28051 RepID=UPI0004822C4A|nr:metal ABC transporter substrate-binding protein [Lachnospira multipara]